jgi:putative transposase
MLKSYKYQLRPTEEQKLHMNNIMGSCRFIYNLALETKINAYQHGKSLTCFDLMKQLTELKKDEKTTWLNEAPSQSLQQVLSNLDDAYTNFFKGRAKFPKFKKRKSNQSFKIPVSVDVDFENWKIKLPKLKWVEFYSDRTFQGTVRQVTISRTSTNKYFISILVENDKPLPEKKPIKQATAVGIDVGLTHFATLSNGIKIENPKFLFHSLRQLKKAQRTLQRRYKKNVKQEEQSQGYKNQKLVVAKLFEKITNQRKDFLHKQSTAIVKQFNTICVEDLNIKGMSARCKPKKDEFGNYIKNGQSAKSGLNRNILDAGWATYISFIKYKCEWYGKNFLQIGRFEPSSKLCTCGYHNSNLTLKDRIWTCPKCNTLHDRDELAAKNIKQFAVVDTTLRRKRRALSTSVV